MAWYAHGGGGARMRIWRKGVCSDVARCVAIRHRGVVKTIGSHAPPYARILSDASPPRGGGPHGHVGEGGLCRDVARLKIAASRLEGGAGGLRSDVACRIALSKTASRYKTPHDGDRFA